MSNDPAQEAVAAREELQQTMLDCATALTNAAAVRACCAAALARAAERAAMATANYIAILESQLSRQQALS